MTWHMETHPVRYRLIAGGRCKCARVPDVQQLIEIKDNKKNTLEQLHVCFSCVGDCLAVTLILTKNRTQDLNATGYFKPRVLVSVQRTPSSSFCEEQLVLRNEFQKIGTFKILSFISNLQLSSLNSIVATGLNSVHITQKQDIKLTLYKFNKETIFTKPTQRKVYTKINQLNAGDPHFRRRQTHLARYGSLLPNELGAKGKRAYKMPQGCSK